MKKTYETLKLELQLFNCNDVVATSVQDGVGIQWNSDWDTGEWAGIKN